MKTSNYKIIDDWMKANKPNGLAKLSMASGVSMTKIYYAAQGYAPKKESTRLKLCKALGISEKKLFPEEP